MSDPVEPEPVAVAHPVSRNADTTTADKAANTVRLFKAHLLSVGGVALARREGGQQDDERLEGGEGDEPQEREYPEHGTQRADQRPEDDPSEHETGDESDEHPLVVSVLREPVYEPEGHCDDGQATDEPQQRGKSSEEESHAAAELVPAEAGFALVARRHAERVDQGDECDVEDQADDERRQEDACALEHQGHLRHDRRFRGNGGRGHLCAHFSLSWEWLRESRIKCEFRSCLPERDCLGAARQSI